MMRISSDRIHSSGAVCSNQVKVIESYELIRQSIESLKASLKDLANPYLAREILDGLQLCETSMHSNHFEKLHSVAMPQSLKKNITDLNLNIQTMAQECNIPGNLKSDLKQLIEEVRQVNEEKLKEFSGWKSLETFLRLPVVQCLENEHVKYIVEKAKELTNSITFFKWVNERFLKTKIIKTDELKRCCKDFKALIENIVKEKQIDPHNSTGHSKELGQVGISSINLIVDRLIKDENQVVLEALVDNFIENGMNNVDVSILKGSNEKFGGESDQLYLNLNSCTNDILKQIVIKAFYALLAKREGCDIIEEALELLKDSHEHCEKIQGKQSIFVIGKTGAGKSTVIGKLLGANFTESQMSTQKVFRICENATHFPPIGHSSTISQTLVAQGYTDDDSGITFIDCPGFDDTRGEAHQLCADLSIDHAVESVASIQRVVVVLPAAVFQIDRANGVQSLIESISNRFPDSFDPFQPEKNSRFFFLITKGDLSDDGLISNLKDGEIFQENLRSSLTQLDSLQHIESSESYSIMRQAEIWNFLSKMHKEGRVKVCDVEFDDREMLLKALRSEPQDGKPSYNPCMKSGGMDKKYFSYIRSAANTWKQIFHKYFNEIPQEIQDLQEQIIITEQDLSRLSNEKKSRRHQLYDIDKRVEDLRTSIIFLENSIDQSKEEGEKLGRALLESTEQLIENEKKRLVELRLLFEDKNNKIREKAEKINELERLVSGHGERLRSLEREIDNLGKGIHEEVIVEKRYTEDEELRVFDCTLDERRRAFLEGGHEHTIKKNLRSITVREFREQRGTLLPIVKINKKYRLVPKDQIQREAALNYGCAGEYGCWIDGEGCEFDLGKHSIDRNTVVHSLKISFAADQPLPWYKIWHAVPNSKFNKELIRDKNAECIIKREEIDRKNQKNASKQREIRALEGEKGQIEYEIQEAEATIAKLDKIKDNQAKADRLELCREQLSHLIAEKSALENEKPIEEKYLKTEEYKKDLEHQLQTWDKVKKRIGLILKLKEKTIQTLRTFADQIDGQEDSTFTEFIEIFDRHSNELSNISGCSKQ